MVKGAEPESVFAVHTGTRPESRTLVCRLERCSHPLGLDSMKPSVSKANVANTAAMQVARILTEIEILDVENSPRRAKVCVTANSTNLKI